MRSTILSNLQSRGCANHKLDNVLLCALFVVGMESDLDLTSTHRYAHRRADDYDEAVFATASCHTWLFYRVT